VHEDVPEPGRRRQALGELLAERPDRRQGEERVVARVRSGAGLRRHEVTVDVDGEVDHDLDESLSRRSG